MASNEILTSLHGMKLGLDSAGRLQVNPNGTGTMPASILASNAVAASAALTTFTAQRAFSTGYYTFPAYSLQVGQLIRVRYQGIQTAVNGTDTIQPILSFGVTLASATLAVSGGTALLTSTATAGGVGLTFWGEYEIVVRTIGATGTMAGNGVFKKVPAAEATLTVVDDILASTTIDTTADQTIAVGLVYGASSASNSCRLDTFRVLVN